MPARPLDRSRASGHSKATILEATRALEERVNSLLSAAVAGDGALSAHASPRQSVSCFDSKLLNALMWFAARSCRTPDFLRSLNHSRDSVAKCTYLTPSAPTELVQQGGITLRGDEPVAVAGRSYLLGKAEYRFPIIHIVRGDSTLPIFVNRVTGTAFFDYGSAFDVFATPAGRAASPKIYFVAAVPF